MVWETREVCGEMNHSRFASFHLLRLLPTNIENASGHTLPTHESCAPQNTLPPTMPMLTPTLTRAQVPATQLTPHICLYACQHGHSQPREFG